MAEELDPEQKIFEEELAKIPLEEGLRWGFIDRFCRWTTAQLMALIRSLPEVVFPHFFSQLKKLISDPVAIITEGEDKGWDGFYEFLKVNNIMEPGLADKLMRFRNLPFVAQTFFNMTMLGSWLNNYVSALTESTLANLKQNLNVEFSPALPDVNAMIQASFIAPEKTTETRDIMRKQGFSEENIDLMFIAAYRLYDPQTVRELYFRGVLDDFAAIGRLEEMGFTKLRITEMMKGWNVIPPIQDLITMVAKEAFEPDMVARYGLDLEFPEEQSEWLSKQGLSRFWQEKYWAAHWDYPSPQQVLNLMHRGFIKQEDVAEYYRVVEMPKYWRDMLMKASHNVYTRVDLRRMHDMGVVTDADLVKNYMDQGYDEEHAGKMAEFTIAFNRDNDKKITQAAIIKAYRNSILTKDDVKGLLSPLKYTPDQIDFMIASADFDEEIELQNVYIKSIKTRFTGNLWDDLQARSGLMKLNLPGARIDALMEAWTAEKMVDVKMPSKTDLDKFLKNKVITQDIYKIEMYRLGYNFQQTEWYLALHQLGKAVAASA